MKRPIVVLLWFFAFWYAGSALAMFLALPDIIGPLLGAAAAAIVFANPRGLIWRDVKVSS